MASSSALASSIVATMGVGNTVEGGPLAGCSVAVDADDLWHVVLQMHNGAVASVRSDFATNGFSWIPDLELNGERGSLALALIDMTTAVRCHVNGEVSEWTAENARVDGPDHILGVQHLVDHLTTGTHNVLSPEHARHVVGILEAASRSAREGHVIDLHTTF